MKLLDQVELDEIFFRARVNQCSYGQINVVMGQNSRQRKQGLRGEES